MLQTFCLFFKLVGFKNRRQPVQLELQYWRENGVAHNFSWLSFSVSLSHTWAESMAQCRPVMELPLPSTPRSFASDPITSQMDGRPARGACWICFTELPSLTRTVAWAMAKAFITSASEVGVIDHLMATRLVLMPASLSSSTNLSQPGPGLTATCSLHSVRCQ